MIGLGFLGAVFMGLVLGLIGGGGSILAVPIFTYLFGIPGAQAAFDSLFVVGFTAAIGTIPSFRKRRVEIGTGILFLLPSIAGVIISRRVLLPSIPEQFDLGSLKFTKDILVLLSFSLIMLAASWSMLRNTSRGPLREEATGSKLRIAVIGAAVGMVTGFVGAGGGFLIVPALVNFLSLSMEVAVGTSLFIIALNSLIGFFSEILNHGRADWNFILPFAGLSLVGVLIGTWLNQKVPSKKLKPLFGIFVLIIGMGMVVKSLIELR